MARKNDPIAPAKGETEAELLKGIGLRFLKLAELKEAKAEETPVAADQSETPEEPKPAEADEKPQAEKPEEAQPTLEEVRKVLAELSRDGHTDEVRALINAYGAKRLYEVDPKDYASILWEAGRFGA